MPSHVDRRRFLDLTGTAVLHVSGASTLMACATAPSPPARRPPLDEFLEYDATALGELVRGGQVTPTELLDTTIARIEALEGSIHALTSRVFDRARDRARHVARDLPFSGVPFMIKDLADFAGVPRTDGAHAFFTRTPTSSPLCMQAMEDSGLNIVAATNVPELATLPTTVNARFGATANPWSLGRTPAGSSGGSAAAVAAGYVTMAHGTDGSGSIRLPASCCGIVGFKPSRHRTLPGEANGQHDLIKHHHVLTRSVRDSAQVLSLTEDRRPIARYPALGFVSGPNRARLRIGVDEVGLQRGELDPEQRSALQHVQTLLSDAGHSVAPARSLPIDGDEFWENFETIFLSRMPSLIQLIESRTGQPFEETKLVSPFTISFAKHARALTPGAHDRAVAYLKSLESVWRAQMNDHDVLLSPVMPFATPAIDIYSPNDDFASQAASIRTFMNFTGLANTTGAPAMSLPLYWAADGMPIGSHFMAGLGQDRRLLELAYELEEAQPWKNRWAPHSARRKHE